MNESFSVFINAEMQRCLEEKHELTASECDALLSGNFKEDVRAFYEDFRKDSYGATQKRIIAARVVEYVTLHFDYFIIEGEFYVYRKGYYEKDGDARRCSAMKTLVRNLLPYDSRSKNLVSEVLEQLATAAKIVTFEEMNTHPDSYICFRNCVYDAKAKKTLQHSPEYRFLNQIPHDYDPDAPLPNGETIERFFSEIELSEGSRKALLTFTGLSMTTDTSLQLFLVLKGQGGSGKSTLLSLITNVIGTDNISSRSLDQIAGDRFAAVGVVGKLCNIFPDIKTDVTIDPTAMKYLTGEDRINVQRKGIDAYEVKPYAKYMFSMNGYPHINARDEAFYRRPLMIPMNKKPNIEDVELVKKLQSEVNYLLAISVKALEAWYEHPDKEALITEETRKMRLEWQRKGDVVAAWIADKKPFESVDRIRNTEAYESFYGYCVDEGRESLKKENFYDSLRSKGYDVDATLNGYRYIRNPFFKGERKEGFQAAEDAPFT